MRKIKAFLSVAILSTLFASCNHSEEKKEQAVETKPADTIQKPASPPATTSLDTIAIYRFKGKEVYINEDFIKTASEQDKALLAYYCYFFNTSCADAKHCKLTEALGLGEQNSKAHRDLVLKWFNDEETVSLAKQGGRITPAGAKNMSWYEELNLVKKGKLVVVRYYSSWSTPSMSGKGRGTDEYEYTPDRIKVISRLHEELDAQ
jgi:hypothetical protein